MFNYGFYNIKNKANVQQQRGNVTFKSQIINAPTVSKINKFMTQNDDFVIRFHIAPDEDAINSAKAVYDYLKALGKKVSIFVSKEETNGLFFNPKKYNLTDKAETGSHTIALDFNEMQRANGNQKDTKTDFSKTFDDILVLDHHSTSENTIKANPENSEVYIDTTSKSCCGIILRLFEGLDNLKNLKKADAESLYCGMLSDFIKSKYVRVQNTPDGRKLLKFDALKEDKNSTEVLEKLEKILDEKSKQKIYKHLDSLFSLNKTEKGFWQGLFSKVQTTKNGKLAYVILDLNDKTYAKLGYDNTKTSDMLSDLRNRVIGDAQNDPWFSAETREKLKDVEGVVVFYRASGAADSDFQLSLTTKGNYAEKLMAKIKENNPDFEGGGHYNRMGGRIHTCEHTKVQGFIQEVLTAAEVLG